MIRGWRCSSSAGPNWPLPVYDSNVGLLTCNGGRPTTRRTGNLQRIQGAAQVPAGSGAALFVAAVSQYLKYEIRRQLKRDDPHSIFEISSTTRWTIRCFGNARRKVFDEEYGEQSVAAKAEFRALLNVLRDQPIAGWTRPDFDRLGGKYRELGKLRFKADKTQHRPIGFFGPGQREFTLLVWATERDGKYAPPGVRDTALQRMKLIQSGAAETYEFDF